MRDMHCYKHFDISGEGDQRSDYASWLLTIHTLLKKINTEIIWRCCIEKISYLMKIRYCRRCIQTLLTVLVKLSIFSKTVLVKLSIFSKTQYI